MLGRHSNRNQALYTLPDDSLLGLALSVKPNPGVHTAARCSWPVTAVHKVPSFPPANRIRLVSVTYELLVRSLMQSLFFTIFQNGLIAEELKVLHVTARPYNTLVSEYLPTSSCSWRIEGGWRLVIGALLPPSGSGPGEWRCSSCLELLRWAFTSLTFESCFSFLLILTLRYDIMYSFLHYVVTHAWICPTSTFF